MSIHGATGKFSPLAHLSYFWVPAVLILFSLVILTTQHSVPARSQGRPLNFHVLPDKQAALAPATALARAQARPQVDHYDTDRAHFPIWIAFSLPDTASQRSAIELPSRHAQSLACWRADNLERLGSANRNHTAGAMQTSKAGFAVNLSELGGIPPALLCRIVSAGPGHIAVVARSADSLQRSENAFYRDAGLLQGGLLILAIFTLVMAVINREARYVLLAVWLFCNLRLAALSLGWDTQWLGHAIPPDWMLIVRKVTITVYYLVTYTLFTQFLRNDLDRASYAWVLRAGEISVILLLLALALPYAWFLPLMWATVSFGIFVMAFFLGRILILHRSRTAVWFSLALGVVLLASFSEVISAAFDLEFLVTAFNSVTAALASSLLVSMALAEQMRTERQERIRAQEELKRSYESTPIGLFTLTPDGRFMRTNPSLQAMLGLGRDDWEGKYCQDFLAQDAWQTLQRVAADQADGEAELRGPQDTRGKTRWFLVRAVRSGDYIDGSLQDITDRVEATKQLRYLANHDPLTGALNRYGIEHALADAVADAGRDRPTALLYLNLNRFKLINALYRNQAGDEILAQVSRRMQEALGPERVLGRLGSDEFLVVLTDTPMAQARQIGERVVATVSDQPYRFGDQILDVETAGGLIEVTADMTPTEAILAAERACREAKLGHTANLVVYPRDAEAFRERAQELRLIKTLDAENLPDGLFLVMQPILSLRAPEESLNFEILLRMHDDDGNNVPVDKLLQAAEASGNMGRIDKWVLTQTLDWLERYRRQMPKTQFVCVNLSGASLNDRAFMQAIFDILERYRAVVPQLCIEITEQVALQDLDYTNRFIARLKRYGARIALDDFGAGYTSFSYLRNLQAEALKIDGSFVQSMNKYPANIAIVETIVALARNLGMRSIAEGVETTTMIETLAELGADYVQGYLITRPQPLETVLTAESAASYVDDPAISQLLQRLADERLDADSRIDQQEDPWYH